MLSEIIAESGRVGYVDVDHVSSVIEVKYPKFSYPCCVRIWLGNDMVVERLTVTAHRSDDF
jgi:hypothetical protein